MEESKQKNFEELETQGGNYVVPKFIYHSQFTSKSIVLDFEELLRLCNVKSDEATEEALTEIVFNEIKAEKLKLGVNFWEDLDTQEMKCTVNYRYDDGITIGETPEGLESLGRMIDFLSTAIIGESTEADIASRNKFLTSPR